MDSWPSNDRNDRATTAGRKGKPKRKEKYGLPNYPDIEQGSLNAVTLVEKDRGLEWLSIVKRSALGNGGTRLHMGKGVTIFPPTRPPILHTPQATILQRAEQGANFIRTFLPDVDIPAELVREEIAQDAKVSRELIHFDPFLGNVLEPVVTYDSPSKTSAFLAFPMGELNRELNLSPLVYSEGKGTSFKPSPRPVRTYETPIQQIISSKPSSELAQGSYVAVRTFGLTSLLQSMPGVSSNQPPLVADVATVQHGDVGNRPIVDIKLFPMPFEGLVVNDNGGLYKFSFDNGSKTSCLVHAAVIDDTDSFWRVAIDDNNTGCLLASKKVLQHLDFRAHTELNLFSIFRPTDILTSVEDGNGDNIIRLCSTREILWIDRRFPRKPFLGYRHSRNWDRSLETQTLNTTHGLTFLTSRNNSLVTIYNISRSTESLIHLDAPPSYLWPENGINTSHCGQAFFHNPSASRDKEFTMFRMSDRGSIHQHGLRSLSQPNNLFNTFWSNDMRNLEQQSSILRSDEGPLGARDFSEANFIQPYDYIFRAHVEEKKQAEEDNAEALYNLLDQIPTFWKGSDAPVEQVMTMYDVLFRAGTEPNEASRADFLTEGVMNSTRGYRALMQDRLSAEPLKKDVAWHHNITPVLKTFNSGSSENAQTWNESLQRYNLGHDLDRSLASIGREKEALEQLVLDLSLSADVFSAQSLSPSPDGNLELENMTKTLSLAGEPPDVDFGYLRPLPKNITDHYIKTENDEVAISIGVRMVVKEWELGADPEQFVFRNHYDGTVDPQAIHRVKPTKPTPGTYTLGEPPQIITTTQSQRPPLPLTATTDPRNKPEVHMRNVSRTQSSLILPHTGSQNTLMTPRPSVPSQEYMTSTQVLPGPFGGRPSIGKKKMAKKRLGGF